MSLSQWLYCCGWLVSQCQTKGIKQIFFSLSSSSHCTNCPMLSYFRSKCNFMHTCVKFAPTLVAKPVTTCSGLITNTGQIAIHISAISTSKIRLNWSVEEEVITSRFMENQWVNVKDYRSKKRFQIFIPLLPPILTTNEGFLFVKYIISMYNNYWQP